jgi:arylsulfatase A-like enzyme
VNNTIVMFSSDNGSVVDDGYKDEAVAKLGTHRPAGKLRGGKYSNFEGGTRVPLIVNWPAGIKPGVSDALVGQQDFFRSFASFAGQKLASSQASDSVDVLSAILGKSKTGREWIVEHSRALSIRKGEYKLIEANPGVRVAANTNQELGSGDKPQLYKLSDDLGETKDLAASMPDKVAELSALLAKVKEGPMPQ